jgi:hypothetical protein
MVAIAAAILFDGKGATGEAAKACAGQIIGNSL